MAKDSIRDYSASSSDNSDIQSVDISEGCAPSGLNNAIREVMADLKNVSTGAVALEAPQVDTLAVATASPASNPLTVQGNSGTGASAALRIKDETDQGATFGIENDGDLVVSCETKDIIFDTNGTNRLRILATGGITFNGDTAAENALDDYEEGTWTPTFSTNSGSAASASAVSGTYTKIGRLVTLNGSITNVNTTGTTSTSQFLVTGMPYTTDTQDCMGAVSFNQVDLSSNVDMVVMADASADLLVFMASRNATGRTVVDHVHLLDDQADLMFTISYITNQ